MTTHNTIKIGGEDRPIHFGWFAFSVFEKETGISFTKMGDIAQDMKVDTLVSFIYAGLMGGANKTKVKPNFIKEDIFDWLDADDLNIEKIFEALTNSMPNQLGEVRRQTKTKVK